jgi:hypothetical protein
MAMGATQTLTETIIWNLTVGKMRLARKADNLTTICEKENLGASTSHKPMGLHDLFTGATLNCHSILGQVRGYPTSECLPFI